MSTDTDDSVDQDAMADDWAAAMQEQGGDSAADADPVDPVDSAGAQTGANQIATEQAQQVVAAPLNDLSSADVGDVKLDVILDIPVTVAMEIGRTQLSIRNLLQLNQGSVIELDRLAGEAMDVLVNGTLVAHGEVVVVNDKFGIRLTDVISPADRIKNLR